MMRDVAIHDPASATLSRDAWLDRLIRFGVKIDARHLVIPSPEVGRITRLLEFSERER